jgi:uncharacterized protein DUF4262
VTTASQRSVALDRIRQNIALHGHHTYIVSGAEYPRFAYTIGVSETLGFELILAGAIFYMADDVMRIINDIASTMKQQETREAQELDVESCGYFSLRQVDPSWATALMLGALDFYGVEEIPALQIVPDAAHWTIDVPNLSEPWSPITAPAWRWLRETWTYPVPSKSTVTTNLSALRGDRITEAARWEEDYWELFAGAGPDVSRDDTRVVPLGTLLAADQSLEPVVSLPVGSALWRDGISDWNLWPTGKERVS